MASRSFEPGAFEFFDELARNNDREWFQAHRADYERLVREPIERIAARAQEVYGPAHVMRPNRDIRFSADKSPYKANAAMSAGRSAAVYLSVSGSGIEVGGGLYQPTRDQLAKARAAIADDGEPARELAAIVADLTAAGFELAGPPLKTAPRGFDRDHRHIDLLRLNHYAALRSLPRDATDRIIDDAWQQVAPLIAWADAHAGVARDDPARR
jgi:uncharacterized protein (TIGR02453 family)